MNTTKNVTLVTTNVPPVLMLKPVPPVLLKTETLTPIVDVNLNTLKMVTFVNHVTSNVMNVKILLITVLIVLKTEKKPQIVLLAHLELMMILSMLPVNHVLITTLIVLCVILLNVTNVPLTDPQLIVTVITVIPKLTEPVLNVLSDVPLVTSPLTIVPLVLETESTQVPVLVTTVTMMMVLTLPVHLVDSDVPDVLLNTPVPFVLPEDPVPQTVNVTTEPPKSTENVPHVPLVVTDVKMVNQKPVKTVNHHLSMLQIVNVQPIPIYSMTVVTNVNSNVLNVPILPPTVTHVEETELWILVNAQPDTMKPTKNNVHHVTCTVLLVSMILLNVPNVPPIPTEPPHQPVTVATDTSQLKVSPFVQFVMKNVPPVLILPLTVLPVPVT